MGEHSLSRTHHKSMLWRTARTFLCGDFFQCDIVLPDLPFLVQMLHLHKHAKGQPRRRVHDGRHVAMLCIIDSARVEAQYMAWRSRAGRRGKGSDECYGFGLGSRARDGGGGGRCNSHGHTFQTPPAASPSTRPIVSSFTNDTPPCFAGANCWTAAMAFWLDMGPPQDSLPRPPETAVGSGTLRSLCSRPDPWLGIDAVVTIGQEPSAYIFLQTLTLGVICSSFSWSNLALCTRSHRRSYTVD